MRTVQENNGLIAEFMEFDKNPNETFEIPQFGTIRPNGYFQTEFNDKQLKFHDSWDWLMPVVDKISKLGLEFQIDANETYFKECDGDYEIVASAFNGSVLDNTFEAVIQFIEHYNNQK